LAAESDAPESCGIFISTPAGEFYLAGAGLTITFAPAAAGPAKVGLATVEEDASSKESGLRSRAGRRRRQPGQQHFPARGRTDPRVRHRLPVSLIASRPRGATVRRLARFTF